MMYRYVKWRLKKIQVQYHLTSPGTYLVVHLKHVGSTVFLTILGITHV